MVRIAVVVALIVLGGIADARAATWTEARSPHFTVYSDAGERRARNVAWQFEQIRATLEKLWPWATFDFGRPVIVYAARDESSMRSLLPGMFEGRHAVRPTSAFISAADAHYVALRVDLDTGGEPDINPFLASYWSYVSMVLRASFEQDLPPWLSRGLADVFSNTIVRDKEIRIGLPIPWHLQSLRSTARLSVEKVLAADERSLDLQTGTRLNMFDATAWALMHFLMFGNEGKNLATFNDLADAVRRGAPPTETLHKLYGPVPAVRDAFANHISRSIFTYRRANVAIGIDARAFTVSQVEAPAAALALARLHAAARRPSEARRQLADAAGDPAVPEIEGMLLDQDKRSEEARAAYAKASAAGAAGFYGEYRLAQLLWPVGDDEAEGGKAFAEMETHLRRSVELNPAFGPAQGLLASVLANLGRLDEAIVAATTALTLASTSEDRRNVRETLARLTRARDEAARHAEQKALFEACTKDDMAACTKVSAYADAECAKGQAQACVSAAFFHAHGRGVPRDEQKAIAMLEPLCAKGSGTACKLLETLK